jgi:hypothetical protein
MRKTFTLILSVMLVFAAFAQKPEGVIKKATVAPVIDGEIDEVWADANKYNIDKKFQAELPTLGEAGETTWKALYTEDGFYLLLQVTDDAYYPNYVAGGGDAWTFDKPEVYFDVNYIKEDGIGGGGGQGHYQFAPDLTAAKEDGLLTTETDGRKHAFKVTKPNYVAEYFLPWSYLLDKDGAPADLSNPMGFDVTIIDRDPGDEARKRAVWANVGAINESWSNMDDCGLVTFEGAEAPVYVDEITLTGGSITKDNDTLRIVSEVLPEDATVKTLKWIIKPAEGSNGRATISSTGLVTAIMDGKMIVQATSMDGFIFSNEVEVMISGQVITESDVNIIKNGNFDMVNEDGTATLWGGWGGDANSPLPQVVDGVAVCTPVLAANNWQYQFNQSGLTAMPNIPYIFKFKAWADANRTFCVDFEDTSGNNYNRYGASAHPSSAGGRSEWTFDITTEPTWYTLDVTFDQMVPTTVQKVQYMLGLAGDIVYLDSISLISEADMALIPTSIAQNSLESFKVYPNPAVSKLHIDLSTPNTLVVIYNSVGVKMEEVTVPGTHHMFDVSRYTKGLYFVKANGAVVKFVK